MMIRRPWPCQPEWWPGGKNYPIRHSQDREGWRVGGGKKKKGIRQDRLVFMLLFDISALLDRPIQMLQCFQ